MTSQCVVRRSRSTQLDEWKRPSFDGRQSNEKSSQRNCTVKSPGGSLASVMVTMTASAFGWRPNLANSEAIHGKRRGSRNAYTARITITMSASVRKRGVATESNIRAQLNSQILGRLLNTHTLEP